MVPFLAPALMAGGSALAGMLSSKTANKGKWKQRSLLTPEQQQMSQYFRTQGQDMMQNPTKGFEPIAQNAEQMFQKRTVPTLAERFTSMGAGNSLSSPAFANQLGEAGQDLHSNLAAMMAQYGQNAQQMGANLMGMGMRPEFENYYQAGGPSALSGLFGGLQSGLGAMSGAGFQKDYGNWSDKRSGNDIESILRKLGVGNKDDYSYKGAPSIFGNGYNPFNRNIQGY